MTYIISAIGVVTSLCVGQKRNVKIHKFLCEDTVESRIQDLQVKNMDLANNVLTGAKRSNANKLTFDDLKMLFGLESKKKIISKLLNRLHTVSFD